MNRYIEKLKEFLADQNPNYSCGDSQSLLEMLYYYYSTDNPIDSALIRCQFKELDDNLKCLSWDQCEAVFNTTCNLCSAFERQAFMEGIHVGLRLFKELDDCSVGNKTGDS